jgi:predicted GIY-YIG superfamily endonuclease
LYFQDRRRPRKKQPPTQVAYILELEGGNYYVGITANIMRRMEQHFTGHGSEWTRLHKPVRLLHAMEVEAEIARDVEHNLVQQMVRVYGAPCVRGAGAARPGLSKNGTRRERLARYRLHE